MTSVKSAPGRERWSSRLTFILGGIGSAVGLGNLWRFPFLVFDFGGGSFLIPFFICLLFIGVPILFLELTLGRKFQGGDPVCFSAMHPRMIGIGWMSLFGTLLLAVYYPVIIAWIVLFFVNSLQSPLPWALEDNETVADLDGSFFFNDVLRLSDGPGVQQTTNVWLIIALAFVWLTIYLSIMKGVESVSKVVLVSVPVPILTLGVLLFASIGNDGASDGIREYVGRWDFSSLGDAAIWQSAVGQVFFSIGVCFGIMTAYSSYMESKKGLLADALYISLCDTAVSIFAGFVVFTTVGVLANDLETEITDPEFKDTISGFSLVFIAYPAGLANLPASNVFSALFFLTLFFLALDSAFSLVEAVVTAIRDTNNGRQVRKEFVTLIVCVAFYVFGLFFVLDNGLYFLDIIDKYLNNYIMLGVGTLECIATMWVFGLQDSIEELGKPAILSFSLIQLVGLILVPLVMISMPEGNIASAFALWVLMTVLSFVIGLQLLKDAIKQQNGVSERLYKLLFSGGALKLIQIILKDEECDGDNLTRSQYGYKMVLYGWAILLKYLIPMFLLMMTITGASSNYSDDDGSNYDTVYENIGKFVVVVAWGIFFIFLFFKVDIYSEKREIFRQEYEAVEEDEKEIDIYRAKEKANEAEEEEEVEVVDLEENSQQLNNEDKEIEEDIKKEIKEFEPEVEEEKKVEEVSSQVIESTVAVKDV